MTKHASDPVITDEDLDSFLATGSEVLRGVDLAPETSEDIDLSEFIRGSVLRTDFYGANENDDLEQDIVLARYFLE